MQSSSSARPGRPGINVNHIKHLLVPEYRDRVISTNGNVHVSLLKSLILAGHDVGQPFVDALNTQAPRYNIPPVQPRADPLSVPSPAGSYISETESVQEEQGQEVEQPLERLMEEQAPVFGYGDEPPPLPFTRPPIVTQTTRIDAQGNPTNPVIVTQAPEGGTGQRTEATEQNIPRPRTYTGEGSGSNRTFTWATTGKIGGGDLRNKRNADGTLIPLTVYNDVATQGNHNLLEDELIPDELMSDAFIDIWDFIEDVNGKQAYDPEVVAMGSLSEKEYMLIPSNWKAEVCEPKNICGGLKHNKVGHLMMLGVYSLAKKQAADLGFDADKQVKWALLRMECYKAGWFDHQRFTKFAPVQPGSITTFTDDAEKIKAHVDTAYSLTSFLPFLAEFYFRNYGSCYSASNSSDYIKKAEKFIQSSNQPKIIDYLEKDLLYGVSMGWIGVKRPMMAIKCAEVRARLPEVFKIRTNSAAAGQAPITTAATTIRSIMSCNWWNGLKAAGGYNEEIILNMSDAIIQNPWKYHMYSNLYGLDPLTPNELEAIKAARSEVEKCAPVLQAYNSSTAKRSDLGKAQALKKLANQNMAVYNRAMIAFRKAARKQIFNVVDIFSSEMFTPRRRRARGADGAGGQVAGGNVDEGIDDDDAEEEDMI